MLKRVDMSLEKVYIKEIEGEVSVLDSSGITQQITTQDSIEIYSTISTQQDSKVILSVEGIGKIKLGENMSFFVDESVLSKESLEGESTFSLSAWNQYTALSTVDGMLLDSNHYLDFNSIESDTNTNPLEIDLDIRDLIEGHMIETKIFENETHKVEFNHSDWNKHDGQVFEDDVKFDLYSKQTSSDEVFTLLIEDTILVLDSQG